MSDTPTPFCCSLREKFLIGIVDVNDDLPDPPELAMHIDWDTDGPIHPVTGRKRPIIRIDFCPFCGKPATGPRRVT